MVALVTRESSLLSTRAFTSLSLISILTSRLLSFIQSLPQFAQCLGCLSRIDVYLSESDQDTLPGSQTKGQTWPHSDELVSLKASDRSVAPKEPHSDDSVSPSTKTFDITWSLESGPIFRNLNLTTNKGITAIVGPSGSGKTTLVETILNEITVAKCNPHLPAPAVGYCAETPWILNDTIRTNIIGVNGQYEEDWYTCCLSLAALTHDLQAFPAGDLHLVGNNGIALSGGQKKRVVSL